MPVPYTASRAPFTGALDLQGFQIKRLRLHDLGASSMTTAWGGTPTDGGIGYSSDVGDRRPVFYDATLAIDVPWLRGVYSETIAAQWNFTIATGTSPIAVTSTTRVQNFNAHYVADANDSNNPKAASSAATASTAAIRDTNARILAGDPSGAVDAEVVTYGFMYSFIQGVRDPKAAVRVIYPTVLPAFTFSAGGNTITADANGSINPVDGQTLAVNDRIGIVLETTPTTKMPYNGIYIVAQVGTAGTPFILQRSVDANTDAEVTNGLQFWVTMGTTYGASGWLLTTADPITLNTTDLTFVQNNGTAGITAGNGIVKVGNTIHAIQSAAYTDYGVVYAATAATLALTAQGASGYYFTGAGAGAPTWTAPAALTKTDDTNVTLTLGGSPTVALLAAASLTLGWTGTLSTARGGTGTASVGTQYGVVYYSTTTAMASTLAGTSTTILHGNAAGAPTWSAVSLTADVTGTLPVANGGTGVVTLADGGLIVGNAASAVEVVAAGLTTQILVGGGALTNPIWGTDIPTAVTIGSAYIYRVGGTDVSVADGGTGASTLTGILYGNGASAMTAGNGTAGTIAKFSASSPGLANSIMTESGTTITIAGGITLTGAQTIQTSTGILTVTGTSGLTLTSGTSNTLLTQNSVNVFTSEGSGAIVNTLYLKAGKVAVGTTVPYGKLTVVVSSDVGISSDVTTTNYSFMQRVSGVDKWGIYTTAANAWALREPGVADRITILPTSGGVGIGVAAMVGTERLSVSGAIYASTGISAGDATFATGVVNANVGFQISHAATSGTFLRANGTNFVQSTLTIPNTAAVSEMLYASSTNVMSALATANSSVLVTGAGGIPAWGTSLPTGTTINSVAIARKVSGTFGAITGGTAVSVTHSLNTTAITVEVFEVASGQTFWCPDVIRTSVNAVTFGFDFSASSGDFGYVIIG